MLKPVVTLGGDRLQATLTERFLQPVLPALERLFLIVRAETDRALTSSIGAHYGRSYPYGCCYEITAEVMRRLRARTSRPRSAVERALKAFLAHGGDGRMVWGVLRGRYFQNAIQVGSLYIDVANDTVDINKPKVEILPMRESGLALVRDVEHFARIGESYWGARIYANTVLPSLAPLFPMILVDREGRIQLQSRNAYMLDLLSSDGFQRSERWLRGGPPAPEAVVRALRSVCPADIRALDPAFGVEAAVAACRALRATTIDAAWVGKLCAMFDRIPVARIVPPTVGLTMYAA